MVNLDRRGVVNLNRRSLVSFNRHKVVNFTGVCSIQPSLSILVFTAEGKDAIIEALFNVQHIDGYVRKGRNDAWGRFPKRMYDSSDSVQR